MCHATTPHRPLQVHPIRFLSMLVLVALLVVCDAWCPPRPLQGSRPDSKRLAQQGNASKNKNNNKNNKNKDAQVVALLHSHHLLDHKPDNLLLKGGKYKLRGVACLGTPGVALCLGTTPAIAKFKVALEKAMPQKRFKTKILEAPSSGSEGATIALEEDGFGRVTLGEFRTILESMGHEAEFFALTGIAPATAVGSKSPLDDETTPKAGGGGRSNPKKKRNRK